MSPFRRKRDEKAMEYQKDVAQVERSRPLTEDYVSSLGRSVYSIIDPEVLATVKNEENKALDFLIPVISHLNRMGYLKREDMKMVKLDLEAIFLAYEALRDEGEYDTKQALLTEALQFFVSFIPPDALEGFKAKLLSYQMKIIRTELEEKKTKGIL